MSSVNYNLNFKPMNLSNTLRTDLETFKKQLDMPEAFARFILNPRINIVCNMSPGSITHKELYEKIVSLLKERMESERAINASFQPTFTIAVDGVTLNPASDDIIKLPKNSCNIEIKKITAQIAPEPPDEVLLSWARQLRRETMHDMQIVYQSHLPHPHAGNRDQLVLQQNLELIIEAIQSSPPKPITVALLDMAFIRNFEGINPNDLEGAARNKFNRRYSQFEGQVVAYLEEKLGIKFEPNIKILENGMQVYEYTHGPIKIIYGGIDLNSATMKILDALPYARIYAKKKELHAPEEQDLNDELVAIARNWEEDSSKYDHEMKEEAEMLFLRSQSQVESALSYLNKGGYLRRIARSEPRDLEIDLRSDGRLADAVGQINILVQAHPDILRQAADRDNGKTKWLREACESLIEFGEALNRHMRPEQ